MSDANAIDYVAAIATSVSALVIAWQAWQTRSAVKASEATVKASNAAVEVAQAALRESQLTRLEAGVPRVFVIAQTWVDASQVEIKGEGEHPWSRTPVDESRIFKLPRDKSLELSVTHKITVRNDGPGSVQLRASQLVSYDGGDLHGVFSAGETREGKYRITKTVDEWVALATRVGAGERPIANRLRLTYTGPRDADITETHEIIVRGSCLVPVPDANGDWVIEGPVFDTNMDSFVAPARREYWRSRSKNLKFE